MDIINNLGISYNANYLVQGNQLERCKNSTLLNAKYTELQIKTDGKDSNIQSILKSYKGKVIFHIPAVNPDLSNLKTVNNLVKKLKESNASTITVNASNLSLDLFEWSTLEEQKMYFLNIVTSIATIVSNKIEVLIENLKPDNIESMFGNDINQITDIIVYTKRLLEKDFGFNEEMISKYFGISLNMTNLRENEQIYKWFELYSDNIKLIKIKDKKDIDKVIDILNEKELNIPILMQTTSELDDVKNEFNLLKSELITSGEIFENSASNNKLTNIIIYSMIAITIIIVVLMFIVKLR